MASGFAAFDDAPARPGRRRLAVVSVAAHVLFGVGLFIASILQVEEIAPPTLSLTFLSAAPPPPPPPPPPAGSSKPKTQPTKTEVKPTETKLVEPSKETPKETPKPEPQDGGQVGGVEGGVKGGVVGGVVGGVIGGTGTDGPKMVPSFTLAAQQLTHPDPHLPDWFLNQHPAQTVKGTYKVCIGTDGKIASVTTMVGIGGVDDIVSDHIRKEWTYKPQPVPVCTASVVVFKIK